MESLFNSVAGLKVCNFITRTCEICEIFKNTLFYITLEVTASESGLTYQDILNVSHKIAPYEIAPTQFTTTWNKFSQNKLDQFTLFDPNPNITGQLYLVLLVLPTNRSNFLKKIPLEMWHSKCFSAVLKWHEYKIKRTRSSIKQFIRKCLGTNRLNNTETKARPITLHEMLEHLYY